MYIGLFLCFKFKSSLSSNKKIHLKEKSYTNHHSFPERRKYGRLSNKMGIFKVWNEKIFDPLFCI